MLNAYAVLGLYPQATDEEVKRTFHRLAKQHHPDAGGDGEAYRLISQAYAILRDPVRRAQLDAALNPRPTVRIVITTSGSTTGTWTSWNSTASGW
jgi:curved DNA-binding protein CbpA